MGLLPYGPEPYASANSATPADAEFMVQHHIKARKNYFASWDSVAWETRGYVSELPRHLKASRRREAARHRETAQRLGAAEGRPSGSQHTYW